MWRAAFADSLDKERKEYTDMELMKFLFRYLRYETKTMLLVVFIVLMDSLLSLLAPLLLKEAIDNGIKKYDTQALYYYVYLLASVYILAWLVQIMRRYYILLLGEKTINRLRDDVFKKLEDMEMAYYEKEPTGKLISILTNDMDLLAEFLSSGLVDVLASLLILVFVLGAMFYLSVPLTLASITVLPLLYLTIVYIRKQAREAYRLTRKTIAEVTIDLQEKISGAKTTKSFAREKENIKRFKELNEKNFRANVKANAIMSSIFPAIRTVGALGTVIVLVYGGYMIDNVPGGLTIGALVAFLSYVTMFYDPILSLSMFMSFLQSGLAALERINTIIDHDPTIKDPKTPIKTPITNGEIQLKNVTFSYDNQRIVLDNITLTIPAKQKIALVGHTGAGKTTLAKLILRYYDPTTGEILIDGHNLKDYPLQELRNKISYVPQEPYLFNTTIFDNITLGNTSITEQEVISVCKTLGIHENIMRFPQKYHSIVGEGGSRLSMGEKQLISFARALLRNPKIIVLDEATANLDPYTELLIQEGLDTLLQNRTAVIIAHRLSTVIDADRIIVLDNGKIVEQGTHQHLLEKQGKYAALYKTQLLEETKHLQL